MAASRGKTKTAKAANAPKRKRTASTVNLEEAGKLLAKMRAIRRRMVELDGGGPHTFSRTQFEHLANIFAEARKLTESRLRRLKPDSKRRASLTQTLHGLMIYEDELRRDGEDSLN